MFFYNKKRPQSLLYTDMKTDEKTEGKKGTNYKAAKIKVGMQEGDKRMD